MTRYFANHLTNSSTQRDVPVGDDLAAAKAKADELFGDGLREGELVIIDSHTLGYVTVASKRMGRARWDNLA